MESFEVHVRKHGLYLKNCWEKYGHSGVSGETSEGNEEHVI